MKNYKNGKLKILESTFFNEVFKLATMLIKQIYLKKVICAQKLDLPIQPSQEQREKEILNAKHNKLSNHGVHIPKPNDIKENWITGNLYLPDRSIILNNTEEYAELNSANSSFSDQLMLVKFNPIKGVAIPQPRVTSHKILTEFGSTFMMMALFWQVSVSCGRVGIVM